MSMVSSTEMETKREVLIFGKTSLGVSVQTTCFVIIVYFITDALAL